MLIDGPHHGLETVAMAYGNALQPHLARDNESQGSRDGAARQDAYHGDCAAGLDAAQGLRQRLFAA